MGYFLRLFFPTIGRLSQSLSILFVDQCSSECMVQWTHLCLIYSLHHIKLLITHLIWIGIYTFSTNYIYLSVTNLTLLQTFQKELLWRKWNNFKAKEKEMEVFEIYFVVFTSPTVSSEVRGAPPSPLTYATRRPPSDAYHGSPLLCLREHLRLVLSTVINQKMWNTTQLKKNPPKMTKLPQ